ncbi:hypothetical protein [Orenia marismortui]|uniref:Uncharacterized protein n=1 Tax=Orenia marismortui TaxID=46469 RepID=A0A4R8GYX4_9FIRM|nr:hypothetical protein [Orenia marismortui]TDX51780.1 hypothetical protein C7959_11024 [Orenia marismortui]
MKKEICTFREEIRKIIDQGYTKVWLNKKASKRIDYIFKLGQEQFIESEVIAENETFILLGQNIGANLKKKLEILFNNYLN